MSPKPESSNDEASGEEQVLQLVEESCQDPPKQPPNPLESASFVSRVFFLWAWPLLKLGASRPLQPEDLPSLLPDDASQYNRTLILELFASADEKKSLFVLLARHSAASLWLAQVLLILSMLARIGQILALQQLLDQLEDPSRDANAAYISATVMIGCGAIVFLCKQQQFFLTYRKGVQLRLGLVAAIYNKAHALPASASSSSIVSAGQVSNLASNDVERYLLATVVGMYLVWGPVESLLLLGVGIHISGPAFAAGFGLFMTVLLPLQFHLSQKFAKLRHQVATDTDARINWVSQAISGARVMKMNAWEWQLDKKIAGCRAREVTKIMQSCRYEITLPRSAWSLGR
jgi:ATP-binding cassette, subfamily C (CFTR/MRP), member 4